MQAKTWSNGMVNDKNVIIKNGNLFIPVQEDKPLGDCLGFVKLSHVQVRG